MYGHTAAVAAYRSQHTMIISTLTHGWYSDKDNDPTLRQCRAKPVGFRLKFVNKSKYNVHAGSCRPQVSEKAIPSLVNDCMHQFVIMWGMCYILT